MRLRKTTHTHTQRNKAVDGNWLDISLATSIASHHLRHHSHRRPSCPQHYANEDPSRCPSLPYIFSSLLGSLSPDQARCLWDTHTTKKSFIAAFKVLVSHFFSRSSFVSYTFLCDFQDIFQPSLWSKGETVAKTPRQS